MRDRFSSIYDNMYLTKKEAYMAGYELAQKEMQEKFDEAIEVIKFYADKNSWVNSVASGFHGENGLIIPTDLSNGVLEYDCEVGGKRARDFLKARGE